MGIAISKDRTPILFQQISEVQELATKFNADYTNKNSVKVRASWGELLEQIRKSKLICVNAKGEEVTDKEPAKTTFEAICRELGIPRSTAYLYIDTHISVSSYPQVIQDAAAEVGLNLALPHVQAKFVQMQGSDQIPLKPSPLELRGIVASLQEAKPAKVNRPKKSCEQQLIEMFERLFQFVSEEQIESGLIRFAMKRATPKLSGDAIATWQAASHEIAKDVAAVRQANEAVL
jgi:hypothetical protein